MSLALQEIVPAGNPVEVLGGGFGFTEGPAADGQGNVFFSDGKNDSIYVYRPGEQIRLLVDDSIDANGMMFNREGLLYVCEGAAHRVVVIDTATKAKRVLVEVIDGVHFNEPNDLAIDLAGGFYFSDPCFQHRGQEPEMKEDVYYANAEGEVRRVSTVSEKPNGVLLTPDNRTLFVADTAGQVIWRYDVLGPGDLAGQRRWIDVGARPDGMTLDEYGNLYVCCGRAGLKIFGMEGQWLGELDLPYASSCVFGGPQLSHLVVTSRDKVLGVLTAVRGVKPLCWQLG